MAKARRQETPCLFLIRQNACIVAGYIRVYCLWVYLLYLIFDQEIYYEVCCAKRLLTFQMLTPQNSVFAHEKLIKNGRLKELASCFKQLLLLPLNKGEETDGYKYKDANAKWCPCSLGVLQTASHHEVNDLFQTSIDTKSFVVTETFWYKCTHMSCPPINLPLDN